MAYIQQVNRGDTYITLKVTGLTYPSEQYWIYITNNDTGEESNDLGYNSTTESGSYTFYDLTPNTTYSFTAKAWHIETSGQWVYMNDSFATTAPATPAPSTPTGLVAAPHSLNPTTEIYCQWDSVWNADYYRIENTTTGYYTNTTNTNYTFMGLTPNTQYGFRVYALNTGGMSQGSSIYWTSTTSARPTNFSWIYSKSSGSGVNLTAAEWNNLVSKVNEFRKYKNYSQLSFAPAYFNNDLMAYMFNEAVNGIGAMSPPTSPPVGVGSSDDVYAYQLNGLVSSLNSIT